MRSPPAGTNDVFCQWCIKPSTKTVCPRPRHCIMTNTIVDENPPTSCGLRNVGNKSLCALGWHRSTYLAGSNDYRSWAASSRSFSPAPCWSIIAVAAAPELSVQNGHFEPYCCLPLAHNRADRRLKNGRYFGHCPHRRDSCLRSLYWLYCWCRSVATLV